jgi:hypothetical protein
MSFPYRRLPVELAFEIFRLTVSPAQQSVSDLYATPRALALVCFNTRQLVMPFLLHTVVLNSDDSLNRFVRTLQLQKELASRDSRLSLNYPLLVRRVWISRGWETIRQSTMLTHDVWAYTLLAEVLCNASSLGLTFLSYHLLYESLIGVPVERDAWKCRRLTFAGHNLRWNPLTSTASGQAYLRRLTHLTIWLPADDAIGPPHVSHLDLGPRVPNWVRKIPFEYMTDLTHFAFSLVGTPRMTTTTPAIVMYTLPPSLRNQHNATIFRTWATSADPLAYGKVINIDVDIIDSREVDDENWAMAFRKGENELWPATEND